MERDNKGKGPGNGQRPFPELGTNSVDCTSGELAIDKD